MEAITLELEKRDVTGKAVKHLRQQDLVPAVIHDHGKPSLHVTGQYLAVAKVYQSAGKHHPVELKAGIHRYIALIKAVDIDPQKHRLRHVVFNAVKADEKVEAEVPVRVKYAEGQESTPAERTGLVVLQQLDAVEVEALPRDLPEALYIDGERLVEDGDSLTVADLIVPANVTVKTEPSHPVAAVFTTSALQAANDAAAGAAEEAKPAEEAEAEAGEGAPEASKESAEAGEAKPADKSDKKD